MPMASTALTVTVRALDYVDASVMELTGRDLGQSYPKPTLSWISD